MFQKIKNAHRYIINKIQNLIIAIILPLTYILGIGFPALFRMTFRKNQQRGWKRAEKNITLESLKRQS